MTCPWCVNGVCRSEDEPTCDFRNLSYDKDSIKERIDQESRALEYLLDKMKVADTKETISSLVRECTDKAEGMKIMLKVLQTEFNTKYAPSRNPFKFTKLILDVNKQIKKFAKEMKDNETNKQ